MLDINIWIVVLLVVLYAVFCLLVFLLIKNSTVKWSVFGGVSGLLVVALVLVAFFVHRQAPRPVSQSPLLAPGIKTQELLDREQSAAATQYAIAEQTAETKCRKTNASCIKAAEQVHDREAGENEFLFTSKYNAARQEKLAQQAAYRAQGEEVPSDLLTQLTSAENIARIAAQEAQDKIDTTLMKSKVTCATASANCREAYTARTLQQCQQSLKDRKDFERVRSFNTYESQDNHDGAHAVCLEGAQA